MKAQIRLGILILFLVSSFIVSAQKQHKPKCGKWRWDVKTLTDQDGAVLLSKASTISSIDSLVKESPPKVLNSTSHSDGKKPRYSNENHVVEISAIVTIVKLETEDNDLHFVLKSPNSKNTMVGEIPDPNCPTFDKFLTLRDHFTKTRQDGNAIWEKLKKTHKPVKVKITGIPFWDGAHKNKPVGSSKYYREIHPILTIVPE